MELKKGFKQTDAGSIPQDWDLAKTGELIEFQGGSQPPRSTFIFSEKHGYVRLLQIRDYKTDKFESYIPIHLANKFCTKDDIMIGRYGPPIFQILKGMDGAYNVALMKAVPCNKLVKDYAYHFLKQEKLLQFVEKLSQRSSGQTGVDLKELREYPFPLPSLSEQAAIAYALSDTDTLIFGLEKLIDKKRNVKQGAIQKLLATKKGWEAKRLGEIGESIIGLTYTPANVKESGTLVLRSSNVQNGILKYDNNVFVDCAIPEKLVVRKNDILICVRNGSRDLIGKCALIEGKAIGETFGAFMAVYRSPYNEFIFSVFQSSIIKKQIDEHLGATINQITNKSLNSFEIPFPSIEEQKEIAKILSDMEAEIVGLESKLEKYKKIKQGMMQNLLTGKIRLI